MEDQISKQYCLSCESEQEIERKPFAINGKHSHYITTCKTCNRKLLDKSTIKHTKVVKKLLTYDLEKAWSDRCISCRFYNCSLYKCKREDSEYFERTIETPDKFNCERWRYKF